MSNNMSQIGASFLSASESLDQTPTTASRIVLSSPSAQDGNKIISAPAVLLGTLVESAVYDPVVGHASKQKSRAFQVTPDFDKPMNW